MSCPHSLIGDPEFCSQCKGAKPQAVTRDPVTGQLLVDGVPPKDRKFMPHSYGYQPAPRGRRPRRDPRDSSRGDDERDPVDEID